MMRKGGTGEWIFRIVLIILLCIIAFYIYQSWVSVSELVTLGREPPTGKDGEKELNDYIKEYNDMFKQILDWFL